MKASIYTLGCRLNQADAALIAGSLRKAGFEMVPWGQTADYVIINSCTVTAAAAQKTRQATRSARRRNPGAVIVLAGCEANVGSSEWDPAEVADLVVPNPDKMHLAEILTNGMPDDPARSPDPFTQPGVGFYPRHTRANLKIQEGCDCFCSYCIVPLARGRCRSRDWDDILREARQLIRYGHREIVLTGVNIAKFVSGTRKLPDLIEALLALSDDFRIRLSSTELSPELPRIIRLMSRESRICRFLHLPIQHGSDRLLEPMKRPYTVAEFSDAVDIAYRDVPGLCLGSDVIVGFPGEMETDFRQCMDTIQRLPFGLLHVFRFSLRPGTAAATMPDQVDSKVATRRARELIELGRQKSATFARSQVGRVLNVLTENTNARGNREGWSDNYLRVEFPDDCLPRNRMVRAEIRELINGRYVRGVVNET